MSSPVVAFLEVLHFSRSLGFKHGQRGVGPDLCGLFGNETRHPVVSHASCRQDLLQAKRHQSTILNVDDSG